MNDATYDRARTGLLLVDPYNDFLAPEGKLWRFVKEVAESVNLLSNLRAIVAAAREAGIQVFFVPHRRWEPGDYTRWHHANRTQRATGKGQTFARGTWGGEFHADFTPQEGDIVIQEHWAQSGFANTDLDYQLKQLGINKIILVGMLANTCIESTGRSVWNSGITSLWSQMRRQPSAGRHCMRPMRSTAPPSPMRSSRRANFSLPYEMQ